MNVSPVSSPSGSLLRSLLIPLTALIVVMGIWYGLTYPNETDPERLFAIGETLAETWEEGNGPMGLQRIAEAEGAERIWIATAAGRIVASSRPSDQGTFVDDSWWGRLPGNGLRQILEGPSGRPVVYAVHAVKRGRWAMMVMNQSRAAGPTWLWALALVGTGLLVWLLIAVILMVGLHRHTRSLDRFRGLVRSMLEGASSSEASLERARAESGPTLGPFAEELTQLLSLVQSTADRTAEAETRFAEALSMMPGVAYLADYSGRILLAGDGLRRALREPVDRLNGSHVAELPVDAPLARVHQVAVRLRTSQMVCDGVPVQDAGKNYAVSLRFLRFRGVEAYFALVLSADEVDTVAADRAPDAFDDAPDPLGSLYRDLVDAADEWVAAFDSDGQLLVLNAAAERETGLKRADIHDLHALLEALVPDREELLAFRCWLDEPTEAPHVTGVITRSGVRSVQWTTQTIERDRVVVFGALIGRMQPLGAPTGAVERPRRPGRRIKSPEHRARSGS